MAMRAYSATQLLTAGQKNKGILSHEGILSHSVTEWSLSDLATHGQ